MVSLVEEIVLIERGGRLTLIKSVLSSLLIYYMSLLVMPRTVGLRVEGIQRDFPWGGRALERRPHLVNWSILCMAKKRGGLASSFFMLPKMFCWASGVGDLPQKMSLCEIR